MENILKLLVGIENFGEIRKTSIMEFFLSF